MNIKKIIIHQIDKEQGQPPRPEKSTNVLTVNTNVQTLGERLNDAFKREDKVLKTEFNQDEKILQQKVRLFVGSETEDNFLKLASDSVDRMIDLMVSNSLSTGGYFVYMYYNVNNTDFLGVFIVRDSEEIIFNKPEDSVNFIVDLTTIVNTNKLAMTVRINMNKLGSNLDRYLHFTHKQQHLSAYFIDWIEADVAERSPEDTLGLIKLIDGVLPSELPVNPLNGLPYTTEEFRNKVHENIHSAGRTVRIQELSKVFWDDEYFLTQKMEDLGIDINSEFQATPNILKRLKKYELKAGKIKLSFSRDDIASERIRKGEADNQLIIDSEALRSKFDSL